ncbi:mismatch repair endonuclease PMS2-like isoform X2 [Oscarella lobularis]|uniref:mismatch repair endonuclease PMS2-like isoform X2 n=1 Tax=Oscarella lobularis TaxID=121494 RepID=UPI00331376B5
MAVARLEGDAVHRICSGQVIVSLASAAKELVENSLDAGATRIEVFLKNYGSELVEVSDNGSGISPSNFKAITLKHYTSKLENFSDLSRVQTLGFRGEALSSLCALSDVVITTRHVSDTKATRLEYDHSGEIIKETHSAREIGTTVSASKLFSSLPVRCREFSKNLKKEYSKLMYTLQTYCLVSVGISIVVTNQPSDSGKRNIVLSNGTSQSLRDNVASVLGAKQLASLVPIEQCSLSDCHFLEPDTKIASKESTFKVSGFVSTCCHGEGRSSADRHYFFINKRPMDLNKLSKAINQVYHIYNRHQFPVVILEIQIKTDSVDVNVTPDKRTVFVQDETTLLCVVRCSLRKMYDKISSTISRQQSSQADNSQEGKRELTKKFIWEKFSRLGSSKKEDDVECVEPKAKLAKRGTRLESKISFSTVPPRKVEIGSTDSELVKESYAEPIRVQSSPRESKLKSCTMTFSIDAIRKRLSTKRLLLSDSKLKFMARIAPEANQAALEELQKEFKKEDFLKLEAIGQFNLGFIIAKLRNDLFIVDQHASDEKFNFERLQKETVLENQMLVRHKQLELTASQEAILADNLDLFKLNGFHFAHDETDTLGKRFKLKSVPVSKNWTFGSEDVQEMLFLLSEFPETTVRRPSRIRDMFASRACRSSVMIGTALDKRKMTTILRHMANLDQPWNCPHGRPTMRHLFNIK